MASGVGTTHHVRLGADYFLIKQGSYRKRPAPLFGARFSTGDPDYNNLSFWQHWSQTCWVGGFGAETWSDDAMFDEGVGVDASHHEVMVLSRDLDRPATWDLNNESSYREFIVFNSKLYCLQASARTGGGVASRLYVLNDTTDVWSLVKTFADLVVSVEEFAGYLIFGSNMVSNLERMNTAQTFSTFARPAGFGNFVHVMRTYRGKCYVAFDRDIWRLKPDFTWDGSTSFYVAQDVTALYHAEIHLGFLYFSSANGHILRTDGNNTFDLWQFEPFVKIWSLRSFDGRLFIGAAEDLDGTTSSEAVLYQFSGAAVTELKRWGRVGRDVTPGMLRQIGHQFMFGASNMLGMGTVDGFGIASYDPVEDAFHLVGSSLDGIAFPPGSEGVNLLVDDVIQWKGWIICSVRGYNLFRTTWSYRDVSRYQALYDITPAGGSPGAQLGGWYTSSDFDAGTPGLLKLWNALTVHVDLPNSSTSIWVEISVNGGQTWRSVGSQVGGGATTRFAVTMVLSDGGSPPGPLRATRLKYRVTLRTTDTTRSPQLRGVIVRYVPIPEPNWVWDMVLVLSDKQDLLDGTIEQAALATKLATLETAFRSQALVHFQDIDGTKWATGSGTNAGVLIQGLEEIVPFVGPSSAGAIERELRVQLIEAVETYEL